MVCRSAASFPLQQRRLDAREHLGNVAVRLADHRRRHPADGLMTALGEIEGGSMPYSGRLPAVLPPR
ncbi:MAG: hypothetical protein ACRDJO_04425 [Actinomycetota bacterium]